MPKKMGRPKKEIAEEQLRAILRMNPTLKDTAAFFECSQDTIEARCREFGNCTFPEFREQNMVHTRLSLIRKAVSKAQNGDNTMLIFCLKNLCEWKDRYETKNENKNENENTEINLSDEQLEQKIKEKMKALEKK